MLYYLFKPNQTWHRNFLLNLFRSKPDPKHYLLNLTFYLVGYQYIALSIQTEPNLAPNNYEVGRGSKIANFETT
jgi:hypothetical protein